MAANEAKSRSGQVLRYTFGGALCLLAGLDALFGAAWYLCLGVAVTGLIIMIGGRRIFRPAVSRTADEIVCRYIPWYEGNAYGAILLIPLLGTAFTAAGFAPGYPVWLRFGGIFLLGLALLAVYGVVRMWLRCLLCITPSALNVRLAERKSELIKIRRELVQSITPKMVPAPVSGQYMQVEIAYRQTDSSSETNTLLLGLRLSVQPVNLLNALVVWKDGADDEPGELLDRIERILRGRDVAGG